APGRVSPWATEARLTDVRAAVLHSVGLAGAASGDEAPDPATVPPERRLVVRADELSLLDFSLAGVASAGEGWTALADAPTGVLNFYRRGDRLTDAALADVQSTDVLLATEEGPLRLPLPDPGR
ncbi:MAG TPA: hypothetical protein VMR21_01930, partial [Vicinamibacteria bacterium]|nr:hypothetical protein [Vicinamibacteria bacterium]